MAPLTGNELMSIKGGLSKLFWGGIGIGIAFIASIIYGYLHPNKC